MLLVLNTSTSLLWILFAIDKNEFVETNIFARQFLTNAFI